MESASTLTPPPPEPNMATDQAPSWHKIYTIYEEEGPVSYEGDGP